MTKKEFMKKEKVKLERTVDKWVSVKRGKENFRHRCRFGTVADEIIYGEFIQLTE